MKTLGCCCCCKLPVHNGVVTVLILLLMLLMFMTQQGNAAVAAVSTDNTNNTTTAIVKIQLDKKSYYPGQTMKINVTKIDTKYSLKGGPIQIVIAPANATNLLDMEERENVWHYRYWTTSNTTTISMMFNVRFVQNQYGLYKVGVVHSSPPSSCCSWKLLGIYNELIRINNPLVSITLPKKQFYQGEAVQLNIYNPYINLTYKPNDVLSYPLGYYRFRIVSTYPSVYEKRIDMITSQTSKSLIVPYEQDEYKIILIHETTTSSGYAGDMIETTYVCDVTNSTFSVVRNYPILSTTSRCDGQNETLIVSLQTTNNIPLMGPYTIQLVPRYDEFGTPYLTKRMKQMYYPKTILNTTMSLPINTGIGDYRIRIILDYSIWALSSSFYTGLCF